MSATKTFKIGLSATDKANMAQDIYEQVLALTFAEYDSGETYNTGDFVVYNDTLYQCLADNVTGTWDSTKWQQATLQDLLDDIESAVASVNGKADILSLENGTLVVAKAQTAQELEAVSPESGDTQETPFILQGTGTANGTAIVDTGTIGKHIQKQGSVYCVNQLVPTANKTYTNTQTDSGVSNVIGFRKQTSPNTAIVNLTLTNAGETYYGIGSATFTDKAHIIYSGYDTNFVLANNIDVVSGHRYLFIIKAVALDKTTIGGFKTDDCQIIDLTQWFNANIPTTLTVDNFSLYHNYGDYIPYNAGELVASNGKYLVSYERNVWDEQWELGSIDASTGLTTSSSSVIRSINYIRVIPSKKYAFVRGTYSGACRFYLYDKNKKYIDYYTFTEYREFEMPSNCCYVKITLGATTYGNNVTISLYYAGEDYSQYYPYEEPHVYDTGDEILLSTGVKINETSGLREDIFDYKTPDGNIVHRVGSYTFTGEETNFVQNTDADTGIVTIYIDCLDSLAKIGSNVLCPVAVAGAYGSYIYTHPYTCCIATGKYFEVNLGETTSSATLAKLVGKTIYFELATPTTGQGTSFAENVDIDDFGSMGWYSAYTDETTNTSVNVPQGCRLFYQAWYRGFIDSLGQREDIDWDAGNIAAKGVLAEGDPDTLKGVITLFNNRIPALPSYSANGTYTLKATMSDGTITYSWVAD